MIQNCNNVSCFKRVYTLYGCVSISNNASPGTVGNLWEVGVVFSALALTSNVFMGFVCGIHRPEKRTDTTYNVYS